MSGAGGYADKPSPALILQDDAFDLTQSVTICLLTTWDEEAPLARVLIQPSAENGLRAASYAMVDKIATVQRTRLRVRVGRVETSNMVRVNGAVFAFLGLGTA